MYTEYGFTYRDREGGHCQGACRPQWFLYAPLNVSETQRPLRCHASYEKYTISVTINLILYYVISVTINLILYYVTGEGVLWHTVQACVPVLFPLLQIETSKFPCIPLPLLPATRLRLFTKIHHLYYACIRPIPAHIHNYVNLCISDISHAKTTVLRV